MIINAEMNWLLCLAAILQRIRNSLTLCVGRCRRRLLPIACHSGFDMILLNTGVWIVAGPTESPPENHIKARYNAEKHIITSLDSVTLRRWDWLAVSTAEGKDISDFFCDLRYSSNLDIGNTEILYLFANQKGWYSTGPMEITLRNGFIDYITVFNGVHRISSNSELNKHIQGLNFIKYH